MVERRGQPLCEIVPVKLAKSTVADFVRLVRSIPKPDEEYLDIVENLVRNQPKVAPSPWER